MFMLSYNIFLKRFTFQQHQSISLRSVDIKIVQSIVASTTVIAITANLRRVTQIICRWYDNDQDEEKRAADYLQP